MSFSKISAVAGALAFASGVAAHGRVTGVSIDGTYWEGYNPNFQYYSVAPEVIGWSTPQDQSNGFIAPDAYATSDIICHLDATNAALSAPINAGSSINLQWTEWPSSHHGPVLTYLANCNGNCSSVDKTTLEWFKIDEGGLVSDTTVPGTWASDTLIANNNSWTSTIPSDIASGNYVIRHEIIALHSAGSSDGAQNYPFCLNLEVTGTGSATPTGVLGTALYSETDAGILVNIYTSLTAYDIPGPTLYSGAVTASQTGASSATATAASSATTTAASSAVTSAASSAVTSAAATSVAKAKVVSASVTSAASTTTASAAAVTTAATTTSSSTLPKTTDAMPAGTTLQDLLSWLYTYIENVVGSSSTSTSTTSKRSHPRSFN